MALTPDNLRCEPLEIFQVIVVLITYTSCIYTYIHTYIHVHAAGTQPRSKFTAIVMILALASAALW
jgi:hypothetical protein